MQICWGNKRWFNLYLDIAPTRKSSNISYFKDVQHKRLWHHITRNSVNQSWVFPSLSLSEINVISSLTTRGQCENHSGGWGPPYPMDLILSVDLSRFFCTTHAWGGHFYGQERWRERKKWRRELKCKLLSCTKLWQCDMLANSID